MNFGNRFWILILELIENGLSKNRSDIDEINIDANIDESNIDEVKKKSDIIKNNWTEMKNRFEEFIKEEHVEDLVKVVKVIAEVVVKGISEVGMNIL